MQGRRLEEFESLKRAREEKVARMKEERQREREVSRKRAFYRQQEETKAREAMKEELKQKKIGGGRMFG